jgi:16S rRNA (guanine(1405)-N(7))-methyltransferase
VIELLHDENADIESTISQIRLSKKYRRMGVCEATIQDLITRELKHHKKRVDAIQAAKKKLHEVMAPYLGDPDYAFAEEQLESAFRSENSVVIRETCARIMASHISTRERLHLLDDFYSRIFYVTGTPNSILDIACGLNPLSFPWMSLPTSTRYHAYDIHEERVGFLNRYFTKQGLSPLAKLQDVLVTFPEEDGDVALILKEVPRFEKRLRGCSLPLFDALRVRYLVVSFASKNLTGRWSLTERYQNLFYKIIEHRPWRVTELEFENELVFCVDKSLQAG